MGIIINQSSIKEVTTANFALEKSALETKKLKKKS